MICSKNNKVVGELSLTTLFTTTAKWLIVNSEALNLSGWGDSNARPLRPERSTLPTALHPDYLNRCECKGNQISWKQIFFWIKICQCGIKSLSLHSQNKKHGAIAQLVEQRTENPCVPGSIPGGTTSSFH